MSSSTDEKKTIKNKEMLACSNMLCKGTHTLFFYVSSRLLNSSYDIDLSPLVSDI